MDRKNAATKNSVIRDILGRISLTSKEDRTEEWKDFCTTLDVAIRWRNIRCCGRLGYSYAPSGSEDS